MTGDQSDGLNDHGGKNGATSDKKACYGKVKGREKAMSHAEEQLCNGSEDSSMALMRKPGESPGAQLPRPFPEAGLRYPLSLIHI